MGFPRAETDPAEIVLAILILADHVIAATILLDGDTASGTLFGICRNPVGRLRIIVTLLNPFLQPATLDRIVPILAAGKTEYMIAFAVNATWFRIVHLNRIGAIDGRTPAQQLITFDETIGDQLLIFDFDSRIGNQLGNGHIVNQYITAMRRARNLLAETLCNDFRCQILAPTAQTETMTTLQSGHRLKRDQQ